VALVVPEELQRIERRHVLDVVGHGSLVRVTSGLSAGICSRLTYIAVGVDADGQLS
jgi:hypothetical protein